MLRILSTSLLFLFVFSAKLSGQTVDADWTGTAGNWSDASQWSTIDFPDNGNGGFDYDVLIEPNASVTLDVNATVRSLLLSGLSLDGVGNTLNINGATCWSGGILQGSGTTNLLGGGDFDGGIKTLRNDHILNNLATVNWSSGNINSGTGAVFNNHNSASVEFDGSVTFFYNLGGTATQFNNMGIVRTLFGAGTNTISAPFNNSGAVQVLGGELRLNSGGTSTGSFTVADQALLAFRGSNGGTTLDGVSITGQGDVEFSFGNDIIGGTYNVGGTTSIVSGATNFDLPTFQTGDLTLTGSARLLGCPTGIVTSTFTFSGGTLERVGQTTVSGNLILDGSTRRILNDHVLVNSATATWTTGNFNTGTGGVFQNANGATLEMTTDDDFLYNLGGATSTFLNEGIVSKTGGNDVTRFTSSFEHYGELNIQSGEIELVGPYQSNGEFNVSSGTVLRLGNRGGTLGGGTRILGGGDLVIAGGTHEYFVSPGEFLLSGSVEMTSNANVFFQEPLTINQLILNSGTREGSATVDVDGSFEWNGGTIIEDAVTNSNGSLLLAGTTKRLLNDHVFNNRGNAEWTAGNINTGSNTSFVNRQEGVFEILHDANFLYNLGGLPSRFENHGTFSKSAGNGSMRFSSDVSNSGNWKNDAGTIRFDRGLTQTSGIFSFAGGDVEVATNQSLDFNGGCVQGDVNIAGDIRVLGAQLLPGSAISGPSRVSEFNVNGDVDLANNSIIQIDIRSVAGPAGTTWDVVNVTGDVDLTPAGQTAGITIQVVSLDSNGEPGDVSDFNSGDSYSWPILIANTITGFDAANVAVDITEFSNMFSSSFSIELRPEGTGQALFLVYSGLLLGDVNGDGVVNLLDVAPFVDAISNGTFIDEADMNRDGVVNLLDVSLFVDVLTG